MNELTPEMIRHCQAGLEMLGSEVLYQHEEAKRSKNDEADNYRLSKKWDKWWEKTVELLKYQANASQRVPYFLKNFGVGSQNQLELQTAGFFTSGPLDQNDVDQLNRLAKKNMKEVIQRLLSWSTDKPTQ